MSTSSSSMSRSQTLVAERQSATESPAKSMNIPLENESKKPPYQVDQQVKFLHLEAEVESLLQQLQSLKQQRQVAINNDTAKKQH